MNKALQLVILFFFVFIDHIYSQKDEKFYLEQAGFYKTILRTKNDTIIYLTTKQKTSISKPTIIFVQGSLPLPILFYDDISTGSIIPFKIDDYLSKFNFVIIGRKGIPLIGSYDRDSRGYLNEKGEVPKNYIENDNLEYRAKQVISVVNELSRNKQFKNEPLFVIGHSEGYRVVAKAAENNKKIAKMVCLSANPFNRISESILKERFYSIDRDSDDESQKNVEEDLKDYLTIKNEKNNYSNDIKYKNWLSYNQNLSFESFKHYKNPLLIVYGTKDIGSLQNDLLPFLLNKKNLKLKSYPNYGHNFEFRKFNANGEALETTYHWDEVFKDVVEWLLAKDV